MDAFLVDLLGFLVLFLADLLGVAAFCGDWEPPAGAAALDEAPPAVFFVLLDPPALLAIFFDPVDFFVLLAPPDDLFVATFPLAIIKN